MAEKNVIINRKTAETDISLSFELYGNGKYDIDTGCGFLDHMLTLFACHGNFDLSVKCKGDTNVDYHHTVEDVGICLGEAIGKALSSPCGIKRYGNMILPMDESLVMCAVDVSGRAVLAFDLGALNEKVGERDTELVKEFFSALVRESALTLHIKALYGENTHHKIEAGFKAFAHALKDAVSPSGSDSVLSTKGVI